MKRYFEFIGSDGKTEVDHSKFWEIWVDGTTLRTRYGKIGANGQTTLKNFDSVADAETAMGKAIAEKTKKGYVEPNKESAEPEELASSSLADFADNPEVKALRKAYKKWAKKYKPVALISLELDEAPAGISEELVWSLCDFGDSCTLTPGFSPYDESSRVPVVAHVITSEPFKAGNEPDSVTTELTLDCEECDTEGYIDGDECSVCEGAGNLYVDTGEAYPLVITTQEELDEFTRISPNAEVKPTKVSSSNGAKFCAQCGTKREPLTAKFCGECGSGF